MVLEKVKELLKTNDPTVEFTVGLVTDEVLNYCNLKTIPDRLENTVVMMCLDVIRQSGLITASQDDDTQNIKSIHEGDTTIQYISPAEMVLERVKNPSFMFNYTVQLNRFRGLRT